MYMQTTDWLDTIRHYTVKFSPDLSAAKIIYEIAPGSPAHALGLTPGDALLSVNGVAASGLDIDEVLLKTNVIIYRFYRPSHRNILDIRMRCMPLGVRFLASAPGILGRARKHGYDGAGGLYALWEQEDYANIQALARMIGSKSSASLVSTLLGRAKIEPIVNFMQAICDYERTGQDEAAEVLRTFTEIYANTYAADVQALGYYYLARLARADADLLYYQEYMHQAYMLNPASMRICQGARQAKINIDLSNPMLGRMLPLHYKFKPLGGARGTKLKIDLPALISHLQDGQVVPLCFMADCRANPAYNQAVKAYRTMHNSIGNNLAPLVVITNKLRQKSDQAYWYKQEGLALKSGLPITILLEQSGSFISDLDIKTAPVFWAVNQSGRVVWTDGLVDAYDYWSLLYAINGTSAFEIKPQDTGRQNIGR